MSFFPTAITEKNWRSVMPALFLLLAAALGGLRDFTGWAVFSALFSGYLVLFEKDFSFAVTGPSALLGLWLGLGLFFSPEPLNSFWHFSKYLVFLAFFAFTSSSGEEAGTCWLCAILVLACTAGLSALFERSLASNPVGFIGANPNYSAAFMSASLAGAAAACLEAKGLKPRLAWGGAAVLFAAGILAINSRGAFMSAVSAVFFLFWLRRARRAALYLALALVFSAAVVPGEWLNWFLKTGDARSLERLNIWKTAFEAIVRHPVFGSGLGLFEQVFEAFKFPFYNGVSYYGHSTLHAHSELLNLAAEAGAPAAALFAWTWGAGVFGGKRRGPCRPQILALKAAAFVLFAEAAVDVIFYSGAVQLCLFGTLGLLSAPSGFGKAGSASARLRTGLYLFTAALAAAFFLKHGFEKNRLCADATCIKKASRFSPGDVRMRKAAIAAAVGRQGNYARTAALAEDAALKYPKDPFLALAAAEAYYGAGDTASARERLFRTLAIEPNFLSARLGLVQALLREKNFRAAAAEFEKTEKIRRTRFPRPGTEYDRALLYLPQTVYNEIKADIRR